MIRMWGG
jgi:coatomer subunit alpha